MLPLLLIALAAAGEPEPGGWERRGALGAQVDPSPHGVLDLGLRRGDFSAQLLTDTIDLRWSPEGARGRWWIAARGELGAAELLFSPWTDGAPDPSRALAAYYGGIEGGWLRYLPRGFYAGAQARVRYYGFTALEGNSDPPPAPRPLAVPELLAGYWSPSIQGWVRGGASLSPGFAAPHIAGQLSLRPSWRVAPLAELRAGAAEGQDFLTRTRLGGLNPYVVPLAGAGWAEWWVEDYAAARLGLSWRPPLERGTLSLGAAADHARFDGQTASGFAGLLGWQRGRWLAEGALGFAPWIERAEDLSAAAGWLLLSADWG